MTILKASGPALLILTLIVGIIAFVKRDSGMSQFASKAVRFVGKISLTGPVDEVFQLFSPLGERLWVPDWKPELLHPPGVSWEAGLIFRTREEAGDAIWMVTR